MCIEHNRLKVRGQHGLTLIELVVFIVIVSVAVAGVLSVFIVTTSHSADPQRRKQALAIAEGLLEEIELARFTYCDPSDANATTAMTSGGCASTVENAGPDAGETRPYDNVNDYVTAYNTGTIYLTNVDGTSFPAGYSASVKIVPEALNGIASSAAPASTDVLRIAVTVTYGGDSITVDGYRTRYDPNAVP
jgi:MSHA pilin protein MshD